LQEVNAWTRRHPRLGKKKKKKEKKPKKERNAAGLLAKILEFTMFKNIKVRSLTIKHTL